MSNPRFIPSLTLLGTLTLACCLAAQTAVPAAIDGAGVTVDTGGPVLHRGSVVYPDAARRARVQGVVAVEAVPFADDEDVAVSLEQLRHTTTNPLRTIPAANRIMCRPPHAVGLPLPAGLG